jgi:hypothetical protein
MPGRALPHPLDYDQFPVVAVEKRNARMVADADAAVVVWDRTDRDLADLLGRCRRKGIPVRLLAPGRLEGSDPDRGAGRDGRRGGPPD